MADELKVLRSDAERNRAALLAAAAGVFAAAGPDAPLYDIARAAGVGVGTLYRRFANRDALIEAVFAEKISRYADRAVEAAERARDEPWPALADFLTFIVDEQASDPTFARVLIAPLVGSPVLAEQHRRALRATLLLVGRVQRAGVVRAGFDHTDIYLMALANAGLAEAAGGADPEASRRLGAHFLRAFRAEEITTALPPVPKRWRGRRA